MKKWRGQFPSTEAARADLFVGLYGQHTKMANEIADCPKLLTLYSEFWRAVHIRDVCLTGCLRPEIGGWNLCAISSFITHAGESYKLAA